jgi:aconitate hydratase
LAGRDYGIGSSRDWAAKGTALLGVRAVIAKSFESIHRSNLVRLGVLPLRFRAGEGIIELGLTGEEEFDIVGIDSKSIQTNRKVTIRAIQQSGSDKQFEVILDLYGDIEFDCYEHGGMFPMVLDSFCGEGKDGPR